MSNVTLLNCNEGPACVSLLLFTSKESFWDTLAIDLSSYLGMRTKTYCRSRLVFSEMFGNYGNESKLTIKDLSVSNPQWRFYFHSHTGPT